jgi:hypothetical protein
MILSRRTSYLAGILTFSSYIILSFISFLHFPGQFSPFKNWLSDLGNPDLNFSGAVFYNTGIFLTAVSLSVFFIGLSIWKLETKKVQVVMLRLTQGFGILGSICMLMSAAFPINDYRVHSFWSQSLYFMLATAFVFSIAALRYFPIVPKWLLGLGLTPAILVNLTVVFPKLYWLEWVTVLFLLGYVLSVGLITKRAETTWQKPR